MRLERKMMRMMRCSERRCLEPTKGLHIASATPCLFHNILSRIYLSKVGHLSLLLSFLPCHMYLHMPVSCPAHYTQTYTTSCIKWTFLARILIALQRAVTDTLLIRI